MLDTGLMSDGYFCDFDRNFSIGSPDTRILVGYAQLIEATEAGKIAAQVGNTAADVFHAMDNVLTGGKGGGDVGRLGHGLGMQLTEWPSFIPDDHTVLEQGMVITLEPAVAIPNGGMLVHEDIFVIRKAGAEQISPRAPDTIMEI